MQLNELTDRILAHVYADNYQPVKQRTIAKQLSIGPDDEPLLKKAVKKLIKKGRLAYGDKHLIFPVVNSQAVAARPPAEATRPKRKSNVTGSFTRTSKGYGFVRPHGTDRAEGRNFDIFIPQEDTRDAADGDVVEVALSHRRGPMGNAFVTRNPLLPEEYFAPKGIEPFVAEMNAGVEHSLLNCPKPFSVKVATFRGNVTMKLSAADETNLSNKLAEAAEKAHHLTVELRKLGYEAYEFHDRHESIVTIGSFDEVGRPRNDGRTEMHPQVHTIIETFRAQPLNIPGLQGGLEPKQINGIPFDVQPLPVAVPQRSIATDKLIGPIASLPRLLAHFSACRLARRIRFPGGLLSCLICSTKSTTRSRRSVTIGTTRRTPALF